MIPDRIKTVRHDSLFPVSRLPFAVSRLPFAGSPHFNSIIFCTRETFPTSIL